MRGEIREEEGRGKGRRENKKERGKRRGQDISPAKRRDGAPLGGSRAVEEKE